MKALFGGTLAAIVCSGLILFLAEPGWSFSAVAPRPLRPYTAKEDKPFDSFTQWSQESYLKLHQKVRYRRAIRRLIDITQVMLGQIFRPLVCSLVKERDLILHWNDYKRWDEFWLHKSRNFSNAERVALGLPKLGPTYVKLGQVLATRPDILHWPLAEALNKLQDSVAPFDNLTAKRIIRYDLARLQQRAIRDHGTVLHHLPTKEALQDFVQSLSPEPVAAASIAQVYKGHLPGFGSVAVKVQRPGTRKKVERDATMFHSAAAWVESRKWPRGTPFHGRPLFGNLQLVQTVDEFTARVFEDMDFQREVENMQLFAELYDHRRAGPNNYHNNKMAVVVPHALPELCSNRVIVMEWLEGTKLTAVCAGGDEEAERLENLALVHKAIECTLSQLIETGLLHADPHTANLLKVKSKDGKVNLGYLDFGLVNYVPQRFRDGVVVAVVQLVFARNTDAIADLLVDIGLMSEESMSDPKQREKFLSALKRALDTILVWPQDSKGLTTELPHIRFQELFASLAILIATFEFEIPPYFLNNVRVLATLEAIGLKLDPDFNILRVIYPFSINHLMRNPNVSRKAQDTFVEICRNPKTKLVDWNQFMILLNDWSMFTGYRKRRIFWDLVTSTGGRHVSTRIVQEWAMKRVRWTKRQAERFLPWLFRSNERPRDIALRS